MSSIQQEQSQKLLMEQVPMRAQTYVHADQPHIPMAVHKAASSIGAGPPCWDPSIAFLQGTRMPSASNSMLHTGLSALGEGNLQPLGEGALQTGVRISMCSA